MAATIYHDGVIIPDAPKKVPGSDVWYGFDYVLADGESITSSAWLIDDTSVTDADDAVNGLVYQEKETAGQYTKVRLTGGTAGVTYKLTNRISTTVTPSDDRSMNIKCEEL